MKNVDVEIYMNQLISFFEKNPNGLTDLIGESNKEEFFERVKKQCYKNIEDGDEVSLTQQQLIMIVVELKQNKNIPVDIFEVEGVFQSTKWGFISLN